VWEGAGIRKIPQSEDLQKAKNRDPDLVEKANPRLIRSARGFFLERLCRTILRSPASKETGAVKPRIDQPGSLQKRSSPMPDYSLFFSLLTLYIFSPVGIGWHFNHRQKSVTDFWLAGRAAGASTIGVSAAASWLTAGASFFINSIIDVIQPSD